MLSVLNGNDSNVLIYHIHMYIYTHAPRDTAVSPRVKQMELENQGKVLKMSLCPDF